MYVTNSLFSPWDKQFYPEMEQKGGYLLQVPLHASLAAPTVCISNNWSVALHCLTLTFSKNPCSPLAHLCALPLFFVETLLLSAVCLWLLYRVLQGSGTSLK